MDRLSSAFVKGAQFTSRHFAETKSVAKLATKSGKEFFVSILEKGEANLAGVKEVVSKFFKPAKPPSALGERVFDNIDKLPKNFKIVGFHGAPKTPGILSALKTGNLIVDEGKSFFIGTASVASGYAEKSGKEGIILECGVLEGEAEPEFERDGQNHSRFTEGVRVLVSGGYKPNANYNQEHQAYREQNTIKNHFLRGKSEAKKAIAQRKITRNQNNGTRFRQRKEFFQQNFKMQNKTHFKGR